MSELYAAPVELQDCLGTPYPLITPDDMLEAARHHAKYLKTVPPREYEMRIFEDGSVLFRNIFSERGPRIFSLEKVRECSSDFWLSPHRPLWRHVLAIWE